MPRLGHRWGLIVRALSGSMRDKKLSESRCKPSRMDRTATCDGRGAKDVAPSPPFLRADPVAPQRAWRILGSVGPRTNLLTNPLANPLGGCRSEGRKQGSVAAMLQRSAGQRGARRRTWADLPSVGQRL